MRYPKYSKRKQRCKRDAVNALRAFKPPTRKRMRLSGAAIGPAVAHEWNRAVPDVECTPSVAALHRAIGLTATNKEGSMEAPQYPAGSFVPEENYGPARQDEFIAVLAGAPPALRRAVAGLSEEQL